MLLRQRRLECGLTQAELAARAGVSRQLVAAVEAGRHAPAVGAALQLARALGTSVEELFAAPSGDIVAAVGELRPGTLIRIGRVGEQLVAAELPDHGVAGASWANSDGAVVDGQPIQFASASPAGVVVAGCDPALGIAEAILGGLGPRSLLAVSAPTGVAIDALRGGRVHAALVHGRQGALPELDLPVARWHFARWQVGVGISRRVTATTLEAVISQEVPVIQRESAASSQVAFERACDAVGARATAGGPLASGHLDGARSAAILGTAAVTTEAAAGAFDLGFIGLEEHAVEIWIDERWLGHPGVEALGGLLATAAFTERVARIGGYDLTGCGGQLSGSH
jgi:DNA-binding XRE family transcriptional regulator